MATVAIFMTYVMIRTSVCGNILVVVAIVKSKELRHSQYIYKCSIALSDFIWGWYLSYLIISDLVTTILKISFGYFVSVTLNHSQQPKESIDNVTIYHYSVQFLAFLLKTLQNNSIDFLILSLALLVSILTLVFAAFDRYVALAYPLKYRSHNTSKYA